MFSDPLILECDWNKVLSVYNSASERNRVRRINRNLSLAVYPLTRDYINNYFNQSNWNIKKSFNYDCAASMYSFFVMTYGNREGEGERNFPFATRSGVSKGFNPFTGFNANFLPTSLWLLLLVLGIVFIKNKTD